MAQPPKVIVAKRHSPQSIGYNSWVALPFAPVSLTGSMVTSTVATTLPLGLHVKFTHLAVFIDGTGITLDTEAVQVNIVEGVGSYESGTPSYGGVTLGGTFAASTGQQSGETVSLAIGGHTFVYTVTTRVTGSLTAMAADIADYFNSRALSGVGAAAITFNSLYYAMAYGSTVSISPLTYAAQTTAYTFSTNSAAGTVTALGANLVAGASGTVPTLPASDATRIGVVPTVVAAAGNALFPVDQTILASPAQAANMGNLYALQAYDANFAARAVVTLRVATPSSANGVLRAVLYGVVNDIRPMEPQESDGIFRPSWKVL